MERGLTISMPTQRILVLTLSFGSGHLRAASAIAQELSEQAPGTEVYVLDALENCRWPFRALYVWPYWTMVRYAPLLWKKLFDARRSRGTRETAPAWAFRYGCSHVFETITRLKPDTIIAVEVAACEMSVIARRIGLTDAQIIDVITDHQAEPGWVQPEVNRYAVPDRGVRDELCQWGAPARNVFVTGIPTQAAFRTRQDQRVTRLAFGLKANLPLVLLMGGGMGPTRMDRIAARLCESALPMQLLAVAGHDRQALKRLARRNTKQRNILHVVGWTDQTAALMQLASLLITKPGGVTLAEAAESGLPVVLFDGIPGPEKLNADYYETARAGIASHTHAGAVVAAEELLRDDASRALVSQQARRLAQPDAARQIAALALGTSSEQITTTPQRIMARA
jgi:processive 1,2-diacylglycerol beta-glucosyltransferase